MLHGSGEAQPVVRDHRDGSEQAGPIIRDHRDDSNCTVEEQEEGPCKDPGIRQCDITPPYCEDTEEHEEPAQGEADACTNTQAAGQMADSGTVYGCAFDDYVYDEEFDTCAPTADSFELSPILTENEPWPDSAGAYISLAGDLVIDLSCL